MKAGVSVSKYHAGMSDHDRNEQQELFLRDEVSVMVATSAFGMGLINRIFVTLFIINCQKYGKLLSRSRPYAVIDG